MMTFWFVISCATFAWVCVGALWWDTRHRSLQGDAWEDSGIRRHRNTGEHRVVTVAVPAARPSAAAEPEPDTAALVLPGRRLTPMSHDVIRHLPMAAPRRYVGRVEVVFPDAVLATPMPRDWSRYLGGAADWQDAMRAGRELVTA